MLDDLTASGAAVVAIAVDPPAVSAKLAAGRHLGFPILSDPARDAIRAYGVDDGENEIAWPAIFIVEADAEGTPRVVWRWAADIYKERIPSAEVLAAVRARP